MRLGYNTNGLQNHRLDEALVLLGDLGYESVALTLDVMHLDPFRSTAQDVERVASLLREIGLQPVVETGARFLLDPRAKHEPTLMTRDAEGRELRLEFYRRAAAIGRDLGAEVLSFWAGIDRDPAEDSWNWLCDGVAATCRAVRDLGLVPALEPEPGMAIATLADFARLRDALGAEAPDLTIDIGHLYANESEPADALIARWGGSITQVHIEDMKRGVHDHLLPGDGDVDFDRDLAALRRTGFRGSVCFELSRSSHMAPQALEICRSVWRHAIVDPSRSP